MTDADLDLECIRSGLSGRIVSLTGMMGAGKSSIGVVLADILGFPFIDNDLEIEDRFGMSIEDIFASKGEAAFRDMERCAIDVVLSSMAGSFIFALGGGAFADLHTRKKLGSRGISVWLRVPIAILASRLRSSSKKRPLVAESANLEDSLQSILSARSACYEEADLSVCCRDVPHVETAHHVLSHIGSYLRCGR